MDDATGENVGPLSPPALSELQTANAAMLIAALRAQEQADESSRSYEQLESLLSALEEGLLVITASGQVVFINDAARRILAFAPPKSQWQPGDNREGVARAVDGWVLECERLPIVRALRGEQFADYEVVFGPLEDLGAQRVRFSCNSIVDHGEVVAIVTCRDVTRLRQLEQMREDFTALISHDLRNPLTIISAAAERLTRQGINQTDDEMRETVGFIQQSAQRMLAMIDQLVHLAALESLVPKFDREPVSLLPLVRGVARVHDAHVIAPAQLPVILGDAGMIERVLINLLTNAAKYSAPGSPIKIEIKQREDDLVVSVSDAGRGISPKQIGSVFDRFYRVPDSAIGSPKGYGLGLYIARLMVEAHGGRIWAESTMQVGSTFSFSLPLPREGDIE